MWVWTQSKEGGRSQGSSPNSVFFKDNDFHSYLSKNGGPNSEGGGGVNTEFGPSLNSHSFFYFWTFPSWCDRIYIRRKHLNRCFNLMYLSTYRSLSSWTQISQGWPLVTPGNPGWPQVTLADPRWQRVTPDDPMVEPRWPKMTQDDLLTSWLIDFTQYLIIDWY